MTYQDILEHCTRQIDIEKRFSPHRQGAYNYILEEHKMVKALIEYRQKYRWHNLAIDPTDVPTGEKRLLELVPVEPDAFDRYLGWYEAEDGTFVDQNGFSFNAVAWREIELFGSEKELYGYDFM